MQILPDEGLPTVPAFLPFDGDKILEQLLGGILRLRVKTIVVCFQRISAASRDVGQSLEFGFFFI